MLPAFTAIGCLSCLANASHSLSNMWHNRNRGVGYVVIARDCRALAPGPGLAKFGPLVAPWPPGPLAPWPPGPSPKVYFHSPNGADHKLPPVSEAKKGFIPLKFLRACETPKCLLETLDFSSSGRHRRLRTHNPTPIHLSSAWLCKAKSKRQAPLKVGFGG